MLRAALDLSPGASMELIRLSDECHAASANVNLLIVVIEFRLWVGCGCGSESNRDVCLADC